MAEPQKKRTWPAPKITITTNRGSYTFNNEDEANRWRQSRGLQPQPAPPLQYRVSAPEGVLRTFNSLAEADAFIDLLLLQNPNYREQAPGQIVTTPVPSRPKNTQPAPPELETPPKLPHYPSEDLPISVPSRGSTPFERMMNVKIANNREGNSAYRRTLDSMGNDWFLHPLDYIKPSYWDSDIHKAVVEGNNIAASVPILATAPAWAPEILPVALRGLGLGLKWRYTTPSGWALGAAAELPLVAYAADQQASENPEDNRNRLERLWDYAWDNPGKTFMTLAGLLAGYNWANNKWGTTPEWKYEGITPKAGDIVPYDSNYAKLAKSLPRRVLPATKTFFKNNWLAIPAAGFGLLEFGNWLFSNPDSKQGNATNTSTSNTSSSLDSLPAGFRPIMGINDQSQVVVPNAAGKPDSIVNIEPVTRNRFGRGESDENQNQ